MRLELTLRGDYAVRAMLALATRPDADRTTVREIAAAMDIRVAFRPNGPARWTGIPITITTSVRLYLKESARCAVP